MSAAIKQKYGNEWNHSRLNPDLVRQIRKSVYKKPARIWAEELGVHIRTIEKVREGNSWRQVSWD